MRTIPLTQGKVALVDDEDYEHLARRTWTAIQKKQSRTWYAVTTEYMGDRRSRVLYMHHAILGSAHDGLEVDHRDGDGLNNQRANLRWATRAQQMSNIAPKASCKSGFKGVHAYTKRRWRAQIRTGGKTIHIGCFGSAEEAAKAYDQKAYELFGEFAWLNFPPGQVERNR